MNLSITTYMIKYVHTYIYIYNVSIYINTYRTTNEKKT